MVVLKVSYLRGGGQPLEGGARDVGVALGEQPTWPWARPPFSVAIHLSVPVHNKSYDRMYLWARSVELGAR